MPSIDRSSLTLREYQPGDEHALLATLERARREIDPTSRAMTLETWRWLFERNPGGRRILLALSEEGQVVSQCAGLGQRVHLAGGRASFCQRVSSVTDPAWRSLLGEEGSVVLTARPYEERFGGSGPDQDVFTWWLPAWDDWLASKAHLDHEVLRTVLKLVAPLERIELAPGSPGAIGVEVEECARFPAGVEAVTQARAALAGAMAVRDVAHLDWRFVERPDQAESGRYEIGVARRGGASAGVAVFKRGSLDGVAGEGLVCDFVAPPDDAGVRAALLDWLVARARACGAARLVTVFPETAPEWQAFQRLGFHAAGTRYFVAGRCWVKTIRMRQLFETWFTTLGDTDLV